jgi:HEAT repeat protein
MVLLVVGACPLRCGEADSWSRKIAVTMVRMRPSEIAEILQRRCGTSISLTDSAGSQGFISIGPGRLTVGAILRELALQADLALELHGDDALLWRREERGRIAELRRRVSSDEDRCSAILALGRTGDRVVIPDLVSALSDPDIAMVVSAVRALSGFSGFLRYDASGGDLPILLEASKRLVGLDRLRCLRLIDACGTPAAESALLAVGGLQPQLSIGSMSCERIVGNPGLCALLAELPHIRLKGIRDRLSNIAPKPQDIGTHVRLRLAAGHVATLQQLIAQARRPEAEYRRAAAYELRYSRTIEAEMALEKLLGDAADDVRADAAFSLAAQLNTEPALPVLLEMLQGGVSERDWRRRSEIFWCITRQSSLGHVPLILDRLSVWIKHDNRDIVGASYAAIAAVASLRSPESTACIVRQLSNNEDIMWTIQHAGRTRDPALFSVLKPYLQCHSPYLSGYSAASILQLPLDKEQYRVMVSGIISALPEAQVTVVSLMESDVRICVDYQDMVKSWCVSPNMNLRGHARNAWEYLHGRRWCD